MFAALLKRISEKCGFTLHETKGILFFLLLLSLGLAAAVIKTCRGPLPSFDYSQGDSIYNAIIHADDLSAKSADSTKRLYASGSDSVSLPVSGSIIGINSASADELAALPGIGPKTALAIVNYRGKIKKFSRITQLLDVKGIGNRKLEKIKRLINLN